MLACVFTIPKAIYGGLFVIKVFWRCRVMRVIVWIGSGSKGWHRGQVVCFTCFVYEVTLQSTLF